jgi:hypothetical protein
MWISNQECSNNLKVGVTCSQVPHFNFYNHALQPSLMTFSFRHDSTCLVNGEKQIKWQSCITRRRESLPHFKQLFTTHRFRYAASLLRRLWTMLMPTKIKLREIHYIYILQRCKKQIYKLEVSESWYVENFHVLEYTFRYGITYDFLSPNFHQSGSYHLWLLPNLNSRVWK